MFFIKKEDNKFTEFELLNNPKLIKKVKKMNNDELLEFIETSLAENELIKIKEIINNINKDKIRLIHDYLKSISVLTKKTEFYIFSSKLNSEVYNNSNMCSREINRNTDWI